MLQDIKDRFPQIASINWVEESGHQFLRIELKEPDLKELTKISKEISVYIDQVDDSDKEYFLDIQSAGTEQTILFKDLKERINLNIKVTLNKPIKDKILFEGELLECDKEGLMIRWNAKGQFRKQRLDNQDIEVINSSAKMKKEK